MKDYSTNKFFLPLMFIACSLIFEFSNFLYLGFTTAGGAPMALPTYFLFDFSIICMLAGVIFLVQNKKAMTVIFFLFLSIQFVLNVVNTTMYSIFGDILSFDLLKLGAEATTAITMDFIDWGGAFLNVGLFAVMITAVVLLQKYNKTTFKIKHFSLPVIVFAIFMFSMSIDVCMFEVQASLLTTSATADEEIEKSDQYLWENFQFKTDAYKKFGHFGFYTKSILNLMKGDGDIDEEWYISYIDDGHIEENKNAPLYNDNLIVILCESMDLFAIDPYNTPTLWKLSQGYNSVSFTNFRARNRTNISEGATLLGSMPKNSFIVDAQNAGYEFDYSLPNLFERGGDENVVTTYVHSNTWSFYQRNITHTEKGLGFDKKFTIEDYSGEQNFTSFGRWISDYEFSKNAMDIILPKDTRFLTYFTTVSTHGPYTEDNKYFEYCYKIFDDNFEDFSKWQAEETYFVMPTGEDFELYRRYKSAFIDFDKLIENLIQEIEIRGLKENTSILMYADHNAYYHDLTYKIKGIEKEDFSNTEVNHIPMILYSPKYAGEEGKIVDDFCNTYDILPTICDLYGLEQNKNLFQGYSIFSPQIKKSLFASHLNGIFIDDIFSNNIADIYLLREDVTEEEIEKFKEYASDYFQKQEILEVIYANGINGNKA